MIRLEKFEIEDIPRLISWVPDAAFLMQWSGPKYTFPLTEGQILETYAGTQTSPPTNYMFKSLDNCSTEVLGHIELLGVDLDKRSATLGRVLVGPEPLRNKGLGQPMIRLALEFGFHNLNLAEIDLGVFNFNEAAIHLYRRFGFEKFKDVTIKTELGSEYEQLIRMKVSQERWRELEPSLT